MNAFDPLTTPLANGITVVEASAGTGKTFALTHLVVRELLRGTAEPEQVLLVTFTNAATDELAGRLRRLLRACVDGDPATAGLRAVACDARRATAVLDAVDRITVRTIHGFCADVLAEEAFAAGLPFDLEMLAEDGQLRARAAGAAWRRIIASHPALAVLPAGGWSDFTVAAKAAWDAIRRPGSHLVPDDTDLTVASTALAEARSSLRAAWKPAEIAALRALTWRNNQATPSLARDDAVVAALSALAVGDDIAIPTQVWSALARLADPESELFPAKAQVDSDRWRDSAVSAALTAFFAAIDRLKLAVVPTLAMEAEAGRRALAERARVRTHDDLLREVAEAVLDPVRGPDLSRRLAERWQLVCVDEFQDTDRRQWDIVRTAFASRRLLLIGDPKQSIYAFRGADVRVYATARSLAQARHGLGTNWRSDAGIVTGVDALFGRIATPYADPAIRHAASLAPPEAPLRLHDPDATRRPFHAWIGRGLDAEGAIAVVADELRRLLADGAELSGKKVGTRRRLRPGDCCVLVRDRYEAASVQDACAVRGLPAALATTADVLDSAEARELAAVLLGVLAPASRAARSAAATVIWGCDAAALRAAEDDHQRWAEQVEPFALVARIWRSRGIGAALDRLFAERRTFLRLAPLRGAERRITNLRHLAELLACREAETGTAPERLVAWLTARDPDGGGERELRLESDADKIRVVTVHRSKGLEYPVVMLPTLWLDAPKGMQPGQTCTVPEGDGWAVHLDPERVDRGAWLAFEIGESARRLYVALTRAQARVGLVWATGRATDASGRPNAVPARNSLRAAALSGLGMQLLAAEEGASSAWLRSAWEDVIGTGVELAPRLDALADEAAVALKGLIEKAGASSAEITEIPAPLPLRAATGIPPAPPLARELSAEAAGRIADPWRTSSFSSLIRGADQPVPHREPEVRDGPPEADTGPLAGFAGGAEAGDALHDILEQWDPTRAPDPAAIRSSLTGAGLGADSPRHRDGCDPEAQVAGLLRLLGRMPLPLGSTTPLVLGTTASDDRRAEWAFHLPLQRLCANDLAAAVQAHDPHLWQHCGAALSALGHEPVHGFLKGFVDLVVRHDGRFHVLDWKSNRLGRHPADYHRGRMWEAMAHSHYALQAVLYLVAVQRWLRTVWDGYDPERHLGGACYVFLRGLATDGSTGALGFTPTRALIDDLDRRLGGTP